MKSRFLTLVTLFAVISAGCSNEEAGPRIVEDFNFGWKFIRNDCDGPDLRASGDYDDSAWRDLRLPHDWSIEGEFSADNPATTGGGALPGGIGWYRKHFITPGLSAGGRAFLEFDGVYMNSTVYVNGHELGTRPYGYSSFCYDITDALNGPGEDNVVAVRCDNSAQPNSRWYSGSGIYRNVRLTTVQPQHIAYNGTYVTTPEIHEDYASVCAQLTISNHDGLAEATVINAIRNAEGKLVRRDVDNMPLATGDNILVSALTVDKPHLWSVDDTYMYTLETSLFVNDELMDTYSTPFGIRKCEWDSDKGFFLNGEHLELQGVCLHHDMGCLGAAVHRRALERELGILKGMGCNAIRTSHNPPAPELLQLCDEMGFLVIDEAFDMWIRNKTAYDYSRFFAEWHEKDMRDFIQRDRNHPCVFLWSIGNEVLEQRNSDEDAMVYDFVSTLPEFEDNGEDPNILLTRHLASIVREMDPSRPVTAGCDETGAGNNLLRSGAIDIYGFNYRSWNYDNMREWFKGHPMFGSETASSLNSRGFYPQPSTVILKEPNGIYETPHHQCTAYDSMCGAWAELHEDAWVSIRDREYMGGSFVWTGFDYLGEPTPYGWPSRSSYFGIVDLAGFPKDIYWMYRSEWKPDETVMHLFPHWNWSEGDTVDIWCYYSHADEVELFVNGRSMGRSHKDGKQLRAQWLSVPFEAGRIEAVSYRAGKEVARDIRETAGKPAALRLTADRTRIKADGYDLSYVTIDVTDAEGREVPDASNMLHFDISGAGELVGIDNGNAIDLLCLKGHDKALFSGKALAVVRSFKDRPGTAVLHVSSEGLPDADISIAVVK